MSDRLLYLIPLVALLLLSMMLHEIMHGYVAYRMGDPTAKRHGRLTLNPLKHLDPLGTAMFVITYLAGGFIFGWAKPVPISPYYFKNTQRGMAIVGLAGPLTNFALAIFFWGVLVLLSPVLEPRVGGIHYAIFYILYLALVVNMILGVFNLVPIPPLDGSRVLGAFLPRRAYEVWSSLDRYGMIFVIALLFLIFYTPARGWVNRGWNALFDVLLFPYF